MGEKYDYLYKFLIIGSAGVGKSCLLYQFTENKFKKDSMHTIGVEFASKIVHLNNRAIKLQIWDTAGQERFRSVARSYYRGAAAALLVYDVTNRDSFTHLSDWLSDARNLAGSNLSVILVGNKLDLVSEEREVAQQEPTGEDAAADAQEGGENPLQPDHSQQRQQPDDATGGVGGAREVSYQEGAQFAQENGLEFVESSAATGLQVEEAFLRCARAILRKMDSGELQARAPGAAGDDVRNRWRGQNDATRGGAAQQNDATRPGGIRLSSGTQRSYCNC